MSEIREQMKVDLRQAMKARDTERVTTLRSVLGAIDNAEAVPVTAISASVEPVVGKSNDVPRKLLSTEDIRQIVTHEIAEPQRQNVCKRPLRCWRLIYTQHCHNLTVPTTLEIKFRAL